MTTMGIDPGADGAIVHYDSYDPLPYYADAPCVWSLKDRSDTEISRRLISILSTGEAHVYLELVPTHVGEGNERPGAHMFKLGAAYKLIVGIIETIRACRVGPLHRVNDFHFTRVPPQVWQKFMGVPVTTGTHQQRYAARKKHSHVIAKNLFPKCKVLKPAADAFLIYKYGVMNTPKTIVKPLQD